MRSDISMRTVKTGYLILSALLCILGICLIAMPDFSIQVLGWVCGGLLLVFGIIKLIGYFSEDLFCLAFQHDLAFGILLLSLGLILFLHPIALVDFYCVVLGLYILADALLKLQTALDGKKFGLPGW